MISWPRVIANEKLWEMTSQVTINMEIRKIRFGWMRHTFHKDNNGPCKAALQWNPQGTRGKPRNS